jgi:hypothetical protein
MPNYTLRRIGLSSNPNDYVVFYDTVEVGRCYLRPMKYGAQQWIWTIYIGAGVKLIEEAPVAGPADTLDEAKMALRKSFDQMVEAGVVKLTAISPKLQRPLLK